MIEGRDIGTVVAPDAEVKVYLVADPASARAAARPSAPTSAPTRSPPTCKLRDESDHVRMQPAEDAERIDTTDLEVDDVVARIEELVRARAPAVVTTTATSPGRVGRLHGLAGALRSRAPARYGARAVPATGGCVLAINHLPGSTSRSSAASRRGTSTSSRRSRRTRVPGLGAFLAGTGSIAVRRGESDRDAVRLDARVRARRRAVGLFVEGTRQQLGRPGPVQPGAAMVAIQEDVPVVPIAVYGTQFWKLGNFAPCSIALGEPFRFEGLPRAAGLQGGEPRDRAAHQRALRLARRRARARPPARARRRRCERDDEQLEASRAAERRCSARSRSSASRTSASRRCQPAHLDARRRRPRDARHDARPQGARLRLGRQALPADRHGRRRHRDPDAVTRSIAEQARAAIEEADLVLLVVDARAGVTPGDEELAEILRAAGSPCSCSRTRSTTRRRSRSRSSSTGSASASRSRSRACTAHGTGDLLDEIVARLERRGEARPDDRRRGDPRRDPRPAERRQVVALQRAVGEERTIVSEVPGTTRDAIDTVLERGGRTFQLVDTAGLRRKRKQRQGIEYYSELRALEAAERADVALVLIDASEGIVEGDLAAADVARKAQLLDADRALEVGRVEGDDRGRAARARSAACGSGRRSSPPRRRPGRGVSRLLDRVAELYDKHAGRIPTGELNRFLAELKEMRQPPSQGRKRLNLLYGAQVDDAPAALPLHRQRPGPRHPRLRLLGREPAARALRAEGVPVAIDFRAGRESARSSSAAGSWGTAFSRCSPTAATR